jgi:hypothetical protein
MTELEIEIEIVKQKLEKAKRYGEVYKTDAVVLRLNETLIRLEKELEQEKTEKQGYPCPLFRN